MIDHITFSEYHNHISYSQLSIPNSIIYYDVTERSRFSYPRVTANRFDLTLQGGPNQHDTCTPKRTHGNCSRVHYRQFELWSHSPEGQPPTRHRKQLGRQWFQVLFPALIPHQEKIAQFRFRSATSQAVYWFRLPPTPSMRLVQFNLRSALPTTVRSLIDTDELTIPARSPITFPFILECSSSYTGI